MHILLYSIYSSISTALLLFYLKSNGIPPFIFHIILCDPSAYLFDPSIPAEDELLLAHAPVPGDVEDHEQVRDLLGVHPKHCHGLSTKCLGETGSSHTFKMFEEII